MKISRGYIVRVITDLRLRYPEMPKWIKDRVERGSMSMDEAIETMELRRAAFPETIRQTKGSTT